MERQDFYVYVYIDPRSFEEFYYGKGCGKRKYSHRDVPGGAKKLYRRIREIKAAGLTPLIRVVAAGLTEAEALLVEKTLIWKLGRNLTNVSSGHYAKKFRPHNSLHVDLPGFDFANDVYYVNVGEGPHRCWEDCKAFGFLSAGGGRKFADQMRRLQPGDVVVAYIKGAGYVGVGVVVEPAVPVANFQYKGRPLSTFDLRQPGICDMADNPAKSDYLVRVRWESVVDRKDAKFKRKAGLFVPRGLVVASLARQAATLRFIEKAFDLRMGDLHRSRLQLAAM